MSLLYQVIPISVAEIWNSNIAIFTMIRVEC